MAMSDSLTIWEPVDVVVIPPESNTPTAITQLAVQLAPADRDQIVFALEKGYFEMGINHLWIRAMSALKRELGALGCEFLGEMLGRPDIDESDDPQDILGDKDALRLAEELGIVSSVEAIRLRQTHELIIHFAKRDSWDTSEASESMDAVEALRALKACVKNILGKPRIEVAQRFVDFRQDLLTKNLAADSSNVNALKNSPYFFRKLSLNILLSAIKGSIGANLELALANLNSILPMLWEGIREPERLQVGRTYAEAYSAGMTVATQGIKQALLKVKGFDFVPESLRSDSFVKAAEEIIKAHEGWDNFHNELAPVRTLEKMGSVIPAHAISQCVSALMCVILGNSYGYSRSASPVAEEMLDKLTPDRWAYYLNQVLPGDIRILNKITSNKPMNLWFYYAKKYKFGSLDLKSKNITNLIAASLISDADRIAKAQSKIVAEYYGTKPR